jgi:DNA-directed RNA polymerase subunit RPC12/RpoP
MESNMETKKCSRCGRELPVTEFGKNRSAKDGLQVFCKECFRQYARNKRSDVPKQGGYSLCTPTPNSQNSTHES